MGVAGKHAAKDSGSNNNISTLHGSFAAGWYKLLLSVSLSKEGLVFAFVFAFAFVLER